MGVVDWALRHFHGYGWSGESVRVIEEHLSSCEIPVVTEGIRAKWQPKPEDLASCREFGSAIARAVKR